MGIQEQASETYKMSEALVRSFLKERLKIPGEEVAAIPMERVHRLGQRSATGKSRPIVVKFPSSKHVERLLSLSKILKGTPYYISRQYPGEVVAKRRALIPIMNSFKQKGEKVRLVVDKLYVNDVLYRSQPPAGITTKSRDDGAAPRNNVDGVFFLMQRS
ncbi:hypothetical protein WMY93_009130 [Mugilogobius chulae]|uniref:Uncharacterized protein n=1 Tax=Mugilogobius chulae TaxID=88201 RepID=A0AAW0PJH4_9GOBI